MTQKRKQVSKKARKSKPPKVKAHTNGKASSWMKALLVAIAIIVFMQLFLFQTVTVCNSSMCKTLLPGDWVLVNKINYGARAPITLLSVPFAPYRYEASSAKLFLDWVKLPYFRLPGLSSIKRNDVVACNYPMDIEVPIDKKIIYLKRIIALPGDTILVKDNDVYINKKVITCSNIQFEYKVKVKSKKILGQLVEKYSLYEGAFLNKGEYILYLTPLTASLLEKEKGVKQVSRVKHDCKNENTAVFPFCDSLKWSLADFGPLIIPKKDWCLEINLKTILLYRHVIEQFEGKSVLIKNNEVLINGLPIQNYFFENDYFFVMDDNRDNPKDSRLWGFLPESHVIGKANFVLASFDPSSDHSMIRWNRFVKKIE